jgi:hypothetical protein
MEQGIDIIIDEITPCLIERSSGEKFYTTAKQVHPKRGDFKGWKFDWTALEREGSIVYALTIDDDISEEAQGLIAFHPETKSRFLFGDLMESNPANVGHEGIYAGIGAHLTAFACNSAQDMGFDTYFFIAKTELIEHYKKTLGAKQIGSTQRMYIDGMAFIELIEKYYSKD